jgi:RNA polymerase sigma-70 factor (ECF subfamily)
MSTIAATYELLAPLGYNPRYLPWGEDMEDKGEITVLLRRAQRGDRDAESQLLELLHRELRHMAAAFLARERKNHTLQATALVNEAYMRLGVERETEWQDRTHFMASAAQAMRHVLVDSARSRRAHKRGGGAWMVEISEFSAVAEACPDELLAIDEALNRLQEFDPHQARIVEMKFFAGMTDEQVAGELGICSRTVKREWRMARAWLQAELSAPRPIAKSARAGERKP